MIIKKERCILSFCYLEIISIFQLYSAEPALMSSLLLDLPALSDFFIS